MGQVTKTTLKTYFNSGDQPSEANMVDFIDSTMGLSNENTFQTAGSGFHLKNTKTRADVANDAYHLNVSNDSSSFKMEVYGRAQAAVQSSSGSLLYYVSNSYVDQNSVIVGSGELASQVGSEPMLLHVKARPYRLHDGKIEFTVSGDGATNNLCIADNAYFTASLVVL
jgi:hypothetical protein